MFDYLTNIMKQFGYTTKHRMTAMTDFMLNCHKIHSAPSYIERYQPDRNVMQLAVNLHTFCTKIQKNMSTKLQHKCMYTVSQKKLCHFFTAYNFRNIEQIITKFGTNQSLFILNIVPEFI